MYAVGQVVARLGSEGARWEYATQAASLGQATFGQVVAELPYLGRSAEYALAIDGRERYRLAPASHREAVELASVARLHDPILGPPLGTNAAAELAVVGFVGAGTADGLPTLTVEALHTWVPGWHLTLLREGAAAAEAFQRVWRATHNLGDTDGDRALNFVITRSEALWARVVELLGTTSAVQVYPEPSRLSLPGRREINVVLQWRADGERYAESIRVDVTGLLPFPTDTGFQPYFPKIGG